MENVEDGDAQGGLLGANNRASPKDTTSANKQVCYSAFNFGIRSVVHVLVSLNCVAI